jgi:hypothetical protein
MPPKKKGKAKGGKKGGKKKGGKKKKAKKKKSVEAVVEVDPAAVHPYWLDAEYTPAVAGDFVNGITIAEVAPPQPEVKVQYPKWLKGKPGTKPGKGGLPRIAGATEDSESSEDEDEVPRGEYRPWAREEHVTGRQLGKRELKGREDVFENSSFALNGTVVEEMRFRLSNNVFAPPSKHSSIYNPSRFSRGRIATPAELNSLKKTSGVR